MNLENLFQNFCKKNNLEINSYQLTVIHELKSYYKLNFNKSIFNKFSFQLFHHYKGKLL